MEKMIERISELYRIGVYKGTRNADYVDVIIGDALPIGLPANCALPSVLCAAKEFGFTGTVKVVYCYDKREREMYNLFHIENGKPTYKETCCCYTIYGELLWKRMISTMEIRIFDRFDATFTVAKREHVVSVMGDTIYYVNGDEEKFNPEFEDWELVSRSKEVA